MKSISRRNILTLLWWLIPWYGCSFCKVMILVWKNIWRCSFVHECATNILQIILLDYCKNDQQSVSNSLSFLLTIAGSQHSVRPALYRWMQRGEWSILLQRIYFLSVPPPQRRHRARSLPVPRGSMHTGGFLSRLALSGAAGQISQHGEEPGQRPTAAETCKEEGKRQIHFAAAPVKNYKSMWMSACSGYFQRHILPEGYYLSLFWLIKNWGNFWEPEQATRLQDQIEEKRKRVIRFLFPPPPPTTSALFSNSHNHPIWRPPEYAHWDIIKVFTYKP